MSVVTVMARYLEEEMQGRGIGSLTHEDCTEILRAVLDRTSELAAKAPARAAATSSHSPKDLT
jgi:hypothetical protein